MNDKDMYYSAYNYGGYTPLNNNPQGMQIPTSPMQQQLIPNTYTSSQFNDMNERINRLERQVKRLDQRLARLETPYANTNNFQNEPDNNMYIM